MNTKNNKFKGDLKEINKEEKQIQGEIINFHVANSQKQKQVFQKYGIDTTVTNSREMYNKIMGNERANSQQMPRQFRNLIFLI